MNAKANCLCSEIQELLQGYDGSLIGMLHRVQEKYGYLPENILRELARETDTPLIDIYSVVTFYKSFSLEPKGKHVVYICSGTACHVRGSDKAAEEISRILGVEPGSTTPDGEYSLETVNCLGACALAPLVVVDEDYYGQVTPAKARKLFKNYQKDAGSNEPEACEEKIRSSAVR